MAAVTVVINIHVQKNGVLVWAGVWSIMRMCAQYGAGGGKRRGRKRLPGLGRMALKLTKSGEKARQSQIPCQRYAAIVAAV